VITDEEWKKIEGKYGKLFHHIGWMVGGDKVTNAHDDSYQEMCITAMEAVETFSRNVGKSFNDFFDTIEFDKYIKTCVWNKKNSLGAKITKKLPLKSVTLDESIIQESAVEPCESFDLFGNENFPEEVAKVIKAFEKDSSFVKPNGKLNINKLGRLLGKPKNQVGVIIKRMKKELKDYENEH
jgi:hypothetical protein